MPEERDTDYAGIAAQDARLAYAISREAAGRAADAAVQGAAKAGTQAASTAAGTALGPWGAAASLAWSARKPIFKTLISLALILGFVLLFFAVLIVALPAVVTNEMLRISPNTVEMTGELTLEEIAEDMGDLIAQAIEAGHDWALAEVERIIEENGYDYEASMDALTGHGQEDPVYDLCYVFAAYSASMLQKDTSGTDMKNKLLGVMDKMYPITYVEKTFEREVSSGGDEEEGGGEDQEEVGESEKEPETETVTYGEFTIHPFNEGVIDLAYGIDASAQYDGFTGVTVGQAIQTMANALKMTLFGSLTEGDIPPITDGELQGYLDGLDASGARRKIIETALSLVGKVKYFWAGKSAPGWNDAWGKPKVVTASGSPSTGTTRPYGLDCSGYTDWVYKTAGLGTIGRSSGDQWRNSREISASELLPGDLGFKAPPGSAGVNHVGIYYGRDASGKMLWLHCSSSAGGVVLNDTAVFKHFRRPNVSLEGGAPPSSGGNGEVLFTREMEVTYYCDCAKCNGRSDGLTASGKRLAPGMAAMSSQYPFGTQLEIEGKLYTCEDRGGKGIESSLYRVDIYVTSHQEALRLGRRHLTAKFYRLGREE